MKTLNYPYYHKGEQFIKEIIKRHCKFYNVPMVNKFKIEK